MYIYIYSIYINYTALAGGINLFLSIRNAICLILASACLHEPQRGFVCIEGSSSLQQQEIVSQISLVKLHIFIYFEVNVFFRYILFIHIHGKILMIHQSLRTYYTLYIYIHS